MSSAGLSAVWFEQLTDLCFVLLGSSGLMPAATLALLSANGWGSHAWFFMCSWVFMIHAYVSCAHVFIIHCVPGRCMVVHAMWFMTCVAVMCSCMVMCS